MNARATHAAGVERKFCDELSTRLLRRVLMRGVVARLESLQDGVVKSCAFRQLSPILCRSDSDLSIGAVGNDNVVN